MDGKKPTNKVLDMKAIGRFCANFREDVIRYKQKDIAAKYNCSPSMISMFEAGKTTNINYLAYYYNMCDTNEQRAAFVAELAKLLMI